MITKKIISCITAIMMVCLLNAQNQPFNIEYIRNDPQQIPVKSLYNSWDGYNMKTNGTLRTLNIFINIIYDQTPSLNPVDETLPWHSWLRNPSNTNSINAYPPPYLLNFLDVDYTTSANVHGYQTRMMYESSFGNYIVLGDFIVINLLQSYITPNPAGAYFSKSVLVGKAIAIINNNGGLSAIYGHNAKSDYDIDGNGTFDFTQIFLRNTTDNYGGMNAGSGYGNLPDSYTINIGTSSLNTSLGTIQCVGAGDLSYGSRVVVHELCHNLFGSNDFHTSGGNHYGWPGPMSFLSRMGGYGLMGAANSGLVGCNGYERERMHWKSSTYNTSPYYIAVNNQNSNISKTDGNKSFILRDFVTTGDAIRIKLPYKESNASNQYIWLENHKVGQNNKLDFLIFSDFASHCRPKGSAGIYAYYQVGRDILSSSNYREVWPFHDADNLRIISAEGNWDYSILPDDKKDKCDWTTSKPVIKNTSNPFNGNNDQEFLYVKTDNSTNQLHGLNNSILPMVKYYNSTVFNDSIPGLGDNRDAFTGNSEISLSTNPSITNSVTYYNYSPGGFISQNFSNFSLILGTNLFNSRKNYLSGLKISMTPLTGGDYKVDIVWDDYNVKNNVRWTGDIVLKEKLILNSNKTITLDQNYTPNKHIKDPISGYFAETTLFTCENGAEFIQNSSSNVNITNKSKLLLKSGSYYEIQNAASLTISENSFLEIEDCATLVIKGNGQLKCLNNGTICIHPNANIIIENQNNIDLQSGYLTGSCLPITASNLLSLLSQPSSYIINSSVQWNNPNYNIAKDIVIENNGVLTIINSELSIQEQNKIVVKPGGKLVINGAKLTSNCNNIMWQGIEVWGTSGMPQESSFSDPNQGIVQLLGGTIENAENAITLWHPGDWYSMGGIVDANGATFLNNRRSVEFMAYQNTDPINGITSRNISQFTNCTFKVDGDYRGVSSNPFSSHVTLWGVNGVFFTACKFFNEQSNKEYSSNNNRAIYSMDAGYTVRGDCPYIYTYGQSCDPDAITKSIFNGFNTAVHATASGTSNVVKIEDAIFEENVRGVQYDGINNSWVNKSEFWVGNSSVTNAPGYHEGIVTIGATGFKIEENKLQLSQIPVSNNYGIRIRNSNTNGTGDNNQIYKNTTTGLSIAERAEGANKNITEIYKGLQILCNRHEGNTNDITALALTTQGYDDGTEGIRLFQGNSSTPTISAGNIFSHNGNDIENSSGSPIMYYHTGGQTEPLDYTSLVFLTVANTVNNCPSYSYGYGSLPVVIKAQLSSDYTSKEATYINLLYNYNSLIDGGNTNLMLQEIEMSWSQDVWDLRAKLIEDSPFLSEEVLREVAMNGGFPQAMLLEICLANPDGTRNQDFIKYLRDEIPNPLPQYMLDLIVANWDAKTARTLLEGSLADVSSQMAVISDLLISNSMLDSIPNKDEARGWLIRRGNMSDYYSVAESYIENNSFTNASYYLTQIPTLFRLTEEQQAEYQNFTDYTEFRQNIADSNRNILQLESQEIETLQQIANMNTGRSSVLAQNILCFGYQLCVDYLPAEGEGEQLKSTKPEKTAKEVINAAYNKITVTPNPANVYVAYSWELPLLKGEAQLIITDISGKSITQKTIASKRGQWIWDTRTINKGIYLYEIKSDNERLGNGKVIINN
ncbi:MAG: T9SS type A sorting domain-containing protein [Bacteroidales bacterium]